MRNTPTNPYPQLEDRTIEVSLRPQTFDEYIGQEKVKKNLEILIGAAQKRSESLEHILLHGPAGLGKTTLAHLIAKKMSGSLKITSGPAIERVGDLASILTNLQNGDVLFIDEAHRLNKMVEEILYPAMEDYRLDIVIGKGPSARTLALELPRFTLIAATTRAGLLSAPLRSRFGMTFRLDFYTTDDIGQIVERSCRILGVRTEGGAVERIARCSRFTPRVANRLLRRIRDYAAVRANGRVTSTVAEQALALMEIDEQGLEEMDRNILRTLVEKFGGGPVGLKTIAAAVNEEEDTIEDVYEPYLMRLGFLARTAKGRLATPSAYAHLGIAVPAPRVLLL